MEYLLSVIALFLSVNFGLPAMESDPKIEFVQATKMTQLWIEHVAKKEGVASRVEDHGIRLFNIQAFYDIRRRTIFLTKEWHPKNPKDLSVLVHEMVHHLQNLDKRTFACPAEREKLAYQAQETWLGLFQTSLETEFEIDAFTLLVSTKCMH